MYRLQSATLGIMIDNNGKAVAITVPTNALIDIVSQERTDGTVDVQWGQQVVNIFAVDLKQRAATVGETDADPDSLVLNSYPPHRFIATE